MRQPASRPSFAALVALVWCVGSAATALAQCEITRVTASDGFAGQRFGWSTAISGDYAVVGTDESSSSTGAAYVYERDGLSWNEMGRLVPEIPLLLANDDEYGRAVAMSGRVAVVGARKHDVAGRDMSGAVYVFRRNLQTGVWAFEQELTASDGDVGDLFGGAVAIDGDWIIVGAADNDEFGISNSGTAYAFHFDGSIWTQARKFRADQLTAGDRFGNAVAISGNWVIVGTKADDDTCPDGVDAANSGSVFTFFHDPAAAPNAGWEERTKLQAQIVDGDTVSCDAAFSDSFGHSVAIHGDRLVVGAILNSDDGDDSGSAYVYRLEEPDWVIEQKLTASDGAELDNFGRSVAILDDLVLIGASRGDLGDASPAGGTGSAYLYRRSGTEWIDERELTASDAEDGDRFGWYVSIGGDYAAIGAYRKGERIGTAYVLAVGIASDCNENGVQDDCEILAEPSLDSNGNGSLDECECTIDDECVPALVCTSGTCNPVTFLCEFAVFPGFCAIDRLCFDDNAPNPDDECEHCISALSDHGWSLRDEGSPCGDPSDSICDHPDTCNGYGQCVTNPESAGTTCTDDGNECTDDRCDGSGACAHSSTSDLTPCADDGVFCNGEEVCIGDVCASPGDPCTLPTSFCDELTDTCKCLSDADCNNGIFCDGLETCDLEGQCVPGTHPCQAFEVCDETMDFCACQGFCVQDGVFCNGEEICFAGVCESTGGACAPPTAFCHEKTRTCRCTTDADCDDGRACTGVEFCDGDGVCRHEFAFDCDGDGVADECNKDCNANDVPDECDIRDGTSLDCQLNGIPDECEIAGFFTAESGRLSPIGALHPQAFTVVSPPKAGGEVTLRFSASGDLFDSSEFIDVDINGVFVGRVFQLGASDCALIPTEGFLLLEASLFNAILGGGDAIVSLTSSGDVDGGRCVISFVTVSITYEATGVGVDCNHNGVPDECDLSDGSSEDCQPNGVPDECDLLGPFVDESDSLVPIDWSNPQSHTIVSPPVAVGDVALSFHASADLFSVSEFIDIEINGTHVGRVFELAGFDCPIFADIDTLVVDPSVYNAAARGGNVVVSMIASAAVDDVCPFSFIAVSVTYEADQNDCNDNGLPDFCDIAEGVSQDCQGNGLPDECEPDCNGNDVPDDCDIDAGTSTDCQDNGVPDECEDDCNSNSTPDDCDIRDETSADCNANGLPDECEADCNGTGVPDDCDIRDGTSIDCDSNGIPDECDEDCNTNGIADGCEIVDGTSVDCNDNGRPDECDVADGTSPDCQDNGVPDECEVFAGFSAASEALGPIDKFNSQTHVFGLPPNAKGAVTLFFTASADLSSSAEFVGVAINGVLVGRVFEIGGSDCAEPPNTDTLTLSDHMFNMLVGDGDAVIGMIGSSAMDTRPDSFISVALHYRSGEVDCNDNGIPDECDLESGSSADCQSNQVPDECEVDTVFETGSGMISPVNVYPPQFFTISAPPRADSDVVISFRVSANRPVGYGEIDIDLNDTHVGGVFSATQVSCSPSPSAAEDSLIVSSSVFNNEGLDGSVTIFMDGFICCDVDPCPNPFIMATVSYERAGVDCNFNTVPDECELAEHDCNLNNRPDDCDIARCPAGDLSCADCDDNGVPDGCDIAADPSLDCPSGIPNGIPDPCETDCQTPGMPGSGSADSCDISDGTSDDCNANGVPDECEPDCNANGIEDSCDLASGTEQDCNINLIPDSCDIESGASSDCQLNGIPDECEISTVFTVVSGDLAPIDRLNPQSFTVVRPPPAGGDVVLTVEANADLATVNAYLILEVNGMSFGRVFQAGQELQCAVPPAMDQVIISAETYNALVAEGDALVEIRATNSVDAGVCPESFVRITLTYDVVIPIGDCNENGVVDECDINDETSSDCNENGTPDDCELDCNGNGAADDCDIASGDSLDCNANEIPDDCEADCDLDGIADECEISNGTDVDCNANDVPDSCEIAEGSSLDCQINGVPDECEVGFDFSSSSEELSPIGANYSQQHRFVRPPVAADVVTLTLEASGDFAASTEFLNVWLNGRLVGIVFQTGAERCAVPPNIDSVVVPAEMFNNYVGDGDAVVAIVATTPVAAFACALATYVKVELAFRAADVDADCDINGRPDECDIRDNLSLDCNGNGILDSCEVGFGMDCNENGIPDECERDCNTNGIPDDCDVGAGTATDCNTNDTLDECELADGVRLDCNGNLLPDECDIESGASADCQSNGIPDECETGGLESDCNRNTVPDDCDIAEGTSLDCQSNDIPDECEVGFVFSRTSENLSPFDAANPQSHRVDRPPAAGGDVALTITASADLSRPTEYIDITINAVFVGTLFETGGVDCAVPPIAETLFVPAVDYNAAVGGTDAIIGMIPSAGLDPGACSETYAAVSISYESASLSSDCNDNEIPDECEIMDEDFDKNGSVDVADYGFLAECLGGANSTPQPDDVACVPSCLEGFDFDADEDIDLKDAAEFLTLFAP